MRWFVLPCVVILAPILRIFTPCNSREKKDYLFWAVVFSAKKCVIQAHFSNKKIGGRLQRRFLNFLDFWEKMMTENPVSFPIGRNFGDQSLRTRSKSSIFGLPTAKTFLMNFWLKISERPKISVGDFTTCFQKMRLEFLRWKKTKFDISGRTELIIGGGRKRSKTKTFSK